MMGFGWIHRVDLDPDPCGSGSEQLSVQELVL